MRREIRICLGALAVLLCLAAGRAPIASAATSSWEFDTRSFDYGPVLAGGNAAEHGFVLTNTGERGIEVFRRAIGWFGPSPLDPNEFSFVSDSCPHLIQPGESCVVGVAFDPLTIGPKHGHIALRAVNEEPPEARVELSGEGIGPEVALAPESFRFESVEVGGRASSPHTFALENHGNLDLAIQTIKVTDVLGALQPASPFQIVGGSCGPAEPVSPGGSCAIEVLFAPPWAGAFESSLEIVDNAPDSPQSIALQGTGTSPPPPPTPETVAQPLPAAPESASPTQSSPPGIAVPTPTTEPTEPRISARPCPKGRRKVVRRGRRICARKHRRRQIHHRRHRSHHRRRRR